MQRSRTESPMLGHCHLGAVTQRLVGRKTLGTKRKLLHMCLLSWQLGWPDLLALIKQTRLSVQLLGGEGCWGREYMTANISGTTGALPAPPFGQCQWSQRHLILVNHTCTCQSSRCRAGPNDHGPLPGRPCSRRMQSGSLGATLNGAGFPCWLEGSSRYA
ncbi:hypothetical protein LZ30DRAFT_717292 [Colletotrichum cereale]|nr:hypothetical protein LZ30DRAFT_717292 [Colletotrichum cereale]